MDIRLIILLLGVLAGGSLILFEKIKGKKIILRYRWEFYSSIFFTVLMLVSLIQSFLESGLTIISFIFMAFFIIGVIMVVKAKQKLIEPES